MVGQAKVHVPLGSLGYRDVLYRDHIDGVGFAFVHDFFERVYVLWGFTLRALGRGGKGGRGARAFLSLVLFGLCCGLAGREVSRGGGVSVLGSSFWTLTHTDRLGTFTYDHRPL